MNTKEKTQAELDEDKLKAEMKVKYNAIKKVVSIDTSNETHVAWFKTPSRLAVGIFLARVDENVIDACEVIFNDAIIQEVSDVAYFQKDEVFYGIIAELQRLVSVKKSTFTTL